MSPLSANNFRLPGTRRARARRARLAGRTGITLSVMLVATLLPIEAWAAPPNNHSGVELPGLQQDLKAKLDTVEAGKLEDWANPVPPRPPYEPSKVAAPAGGTAPVALSGDQLVQAGALPVAIGKASPTEANPAPPTPSGTWQVAVESRAVTEAANVDGALIKVTPPAGSSTPVDVQLDYKEFKDLYGTEWATRLEIKQLPECFLTTPALPECSVAVDIPSTNKAEDGTVRATIDPAVVPSQGMSTMSGGGAVVLAASDGASGAGGTYKATSLGPSGSWSAGGSSGGFSWTYPVSVPPAPAGPTPSIAFSYSSQAVDGKTSVANGQASWIGDGWDYNPGFIERRYRSCSDDREPSPGKPNNDNAIDKKKGDLCWAGDNVVMSLGGGSTELVKDTNGQWVATSDDGSKIERKTGGAANGAHEGEYWIVTKRDGTKYHFGLHNVGTHGDGTSPQNVTKSVFTVPVFGNHTGEPCNALKYADSSCQQAWRWNLDYVEDIHGNAMIIDWAPETNRYAKNQNFKEKDAAKVGYTRGGHPVRILYGLRVGALSGAPAGKVEFGIDERCVAEGSVKCGDTQFESKNYGDKQAWWDTPSTLHCKADAEDCYISSPTFWSRKRLSTVTTYGQRTAGSTALTKVDQWALVQSFPKQRTDTSPPLWLESITRTGYGTKDGVGTSLPAVSFIANATDMPNRVAKSTTDATPDFDRLRVETIRTETGGDIYVDYSDPCPVGGAHPKPEENTTRCFPVRWSPDSELETPPLEWFNKYVVNSVVEKDRVARQPDVTTSYTYEGGAAWAKEDDEFSKPELRTYSQWRGYASVVTQRGITANAGKADSTEQSQTRTRYFRGMSGDAGRPEIVVKDSTGVEELGKDLPQYQGREAESITYTKAGGSIVSRFLTWPWRSDPTALRTRADNTPLEAYRTGTARTDEIQSVSGGKSRMVRTLTAYEQTAASYGLTLTTQIDVREHNGTDWATVEQSCTKPSYVHNTGKHLIGLVHEVRTTTGDCTQAATGTLLSAVRTSYAADNSFGTVPLNGLAYQVDSLDGSGTGWLTSSRVEYDQLGRAVKTYDAASTPSSVSFNPATGPAFSVTASNALGHTVTTKFDPARGSVLEAIDANARKVTTEYDNLGRTTAVWTPSQNPATDKAAQTFTYQIKEHEPPVVTSATLQDDGTYTRSIAIYDGLLRPRQAQTEALGGGRLITDTLYSENGTVRRTDNAYLAENLPDSKIFVPDSMTAVRNSTQFAYDGLGRTVRTTALHDGIANQSTTTQYGGDWTLTRSAMDATGAAPLPGSRAVKTTTDALGRTAKVEHYTSTAAADVDPAKNPNPATNKTSYAYDVRGNLAKVTDAADNNWTYAYDARGRMTSSADPDMGTTKFTYNNLDQQTSTTNPHNSAQHTKYDVLGRKTELRNDNPDTGTLIASWTYDTLPGAKGLPVAASRSWSGGSYTSEVTGYDTESRPTGSKITIPDLPTTKGLAGTYAYSTTYTPTGKVQSTTLPATPGGLAAENLVIRHNADGMPQTMSGQSWYTADTIYSPHGQLLRTASGDAPNRVWTTNSYNPHTGRITEASSHRETRTTPASKPTNLISALAYTHDAVGNPTSITDTQPGTDAQPVPRVDRQCFTYDAMGQLTKAWTGKTAACTGPTLTDVDLGPDGDGYWQEYQFDTIGNRTKLTNKDLTNATLDDVTTYTYGVEVTGGAQPPVKRQPHALTKVNKTTKTAGSTIDSLSTYTYDLAGNTQTRTIDGDTQTLAWDRRNKLQSATSPGIGAVAITGLAGKCLDVENGGTTNGTPAQVTACNETKAQQWRLTGETVQALGKCLTAEDTAEGRRARLNTCDGNARQKFTYRAEDKTLYNPATGECVTVPNNNATDGNDLHIFTCVAGAEAQQWAFNNGTSYLYDAEGNRRIEETGSSRTLYLGEAEITVNKAGQAIDAVRYYSGTGATTVRRTNGKTTGHTLTALLTDHHDTATTSVDLAAGQTVTRRKSDPYGNPRGTQPANWPGSRTFLGTGNDDSTTGLTHIGAREYDPTTGRFISVDPIIDNTDPLQMNGYTYANNNPISRSDPSGLKSEECGTLYDCGSNISITSSNSSSITYGIDSAQLRYYQSTSRSSYGNRDTRVRDNRVKRHQDLLRNKPDHKPTWTNLVTGIIRGWLSSIDATPGGQVLSQFGMSGSDVANQAFDGLGIEYDENALESTVGEWVAPTPPIFKAGKAGKAGNGLIGTAPKRCDSFLAGTKVLLVDGTSKPIEQLTTADEVIATDPENGETKAKAVTATIYSEDDKAYVDVSIQTDNGIKTITTTDHHPFWSESDQTWTDAGDLKPGTTLRTDTDGTAVVVRVLTYQAVNETYNLTVADLHTYYVLAGATPVLVHNCGGYFPGHADSCTCEGIGDVTPKVVPKAANPADDFTRHAMQRLERRGVSAEDAQAVLGREPFSYRHDDQWKMGYYDPNSKVFVAKTIDGNINTVMTNVERSYINRLQGGR